MLSATIKELRHLLASAIWDFKAYEVPAVCRRLGLADGSEQEAFSSKYKYAQVRLAEIKADQLIQIACDLVAEHPNFALQELITKDEEKDLPRTTELTRRRIVALFEEMPLCTEVDELEFIERVWPIDSMPAHYQPEVGCSLKDEIIQHTIRNDDWSIRDLLQALGILSCSQAQFFLFLNAVTDPVVQSQESQAKLVKQINAHLRHDGYALIVSGHISGSPRYEVKPRPKGAPADDGISAMLAAFSPDDVHARWTAALARRATDPPGAITLSRTLLEDVCKWVLTDAGESFKDGDDLPVLYRRLAKTLKLAPDDYTEKVFKQILGSCQSVVESLGALRNKLGDAHSPGPKRARPLPRHAELAVNLAGAMAVFLVSTWQARKLERNDPPR